VPVWTVAQYMGHKSTQMIEETYGHLDTVKNRVPDLEFRVENHTEGPGGEAPEPPPKCLFVTIVVTIARKAPPKERRLPGRKPRRRRMKQRSAPPGTRTPNLLIKSSVAAYTQSATEVA